MIDSAYMSILPKATDAASWENPIHTAVTFEVECHRTSFTLGIFDTVDKRFIKFIEIEKPSFVVVDETNWASYIDHCIDTLGTLSGPKSTQKSWELESGIKLAKRKTIGLIAIQVIELDGSSYRLTTLEKTENFSGSKLNVQYKLFDSRFDTIIDYVYMSADLTGITFRPVGIDKSFIGESYRLQFVKDISISTLYYSAMPKGPLTKDQIMDLTSHHGFISPQHSNLMMWKNIGDFHYLESRDGKFKIVLHEKLEEPTINLIREALLIAIPLNEVKGLYGTLRHTNANDSLTSVFRFVEKLQSR